MSENTAVEVARPATRELVDLRAGYTSVQADSEENGELVFNALTNATPLADVLGQTLNVVNVITQPAEGVNEETGEPQFYTRSILIDDKGDAYVAGSEGLTIALTNLFIAFGPAHTWTKPRPLSVIKRKGNGKNRDFFSIQLAK